MEISPPRICTWCAAHAAWANIVVFGRTLFLVDRDGVLLAAVEQICSNGLAKYCLEHLEDNMAKKHLYPKWNHEKYGQLWRQWACAPTKREANVFADMLRDLKPKQYQFLAELNPKNWLFSKALTTGIRTYGIHDNNAAESPSASVRQNLYLDFGVLTSQ